MRQKRKFRKRHHKKPSKNLVRFVNKVVAKERIAKHLYYGFEATLSSVTDNGFAFINGMSEGTSWGQRIGQRIRIVYVSYRVTAHSSLATNAATSDTNTIARVMLVHQRGTDGTNMLVIDDDSGLFNTTNFQTMSSQVPNPTTNVIRGDPTKKKGGQYYSILRDQIKTLNAYYNGQTQNGTPTVGGIAHFGGFWRPPKGMYVNYNELNTAGVGDVIDNAINIVFGIDPVNSGNTVTFAVTYDICYEDA